MGTRKKQIENHSHGKRSKHIKLHPNTRSKPSCRKTVSLLLTVKLHLLSLQMDDEPFNPDYVEVDRVLDVSESTDENGEVL